ncbi:hypothetical protein SJ05684_c10930 [Sinorhizobium sojae CCBAU 05684]|uniref:Uncharacterized protein n=2 Tax=Sinorhizobium sojae CCBAU 05684 TaxID=716928 RepID=A0A249P9E4_9HYPH|nr:hypothetical protein [Sinorhizobium sojae]ASY62550.1 hypothetical protein SJ05684_c10930 [Sinorhizobium sojae CCBAU 05684]
MTTESETQRSLGRLEGKLDMILADQEQARFARQHQMEKSEAIERRLDATDQKLSSVTDRFNEAAPIISDIKRWKERFIGAQMLIAGVFVAIGGGLPCCGNGWP